MFNIGFSELVMLGIIALIFIPPRDLPRMARTIGRVLNELKRAGEDAMGSLTEAQTRANKYMEETRKAVVETEIKAPVPATEKEKSDG